MIFAISHASILTVAEFLVLLFFCCLRESRCRLQFRYGSIKCRQFLRTCRFSVSVVFLDEITAWIDSAKVLLDSSFFLLSLRKFLFLCFELLLSISQVLLLCHNLILQILLSFLQSRHAIFVSMLVCELISVNFFSFFFCFFQHKLEHVNDLVPLNAFASVRICCPCSWRCRVFLHKARFYFLLISRVKIGVILLQSRDRSAQENS